VVAARRRHRFPCRARAIEERGEIVASITLTGARERVWLEDLMVLPSHRRRGLGRELFRAAESEARALGARSVGFSASAADWPSSWYERDGFAVDGEVVRLRRLL
jgi:GNAT superfamily N-acetyltransferase